MKKIIATLILSTSISVAEIPVIDIRKNMGGYEIGFNVFNVLDTDYQRPHGFAQQGRSMSLSFKRTF